MSTKHRGRIAGDPVTYRLPTPAGGVRLETFVPWTLVKRGAKKEIITPLDAPQQFLVEADQDREARAGAQNSALRRALGLAHHWQRLLDEGRLASLTDIAAAEGLDLGQVSKIARLVHLAPAIIDASLREDACGLTLEALARGGRLPLSWQAQQERFRL